tara:strand:- start:326 stop:646 length:321 start_codon:yes stop_codon:yes gene_type:complete
MERKNWTIGEIEMLRDNYGDLSTKEIATMLGRTRSSINNQIAKLGLKEHLSPVNNLPNPENYNSSSNFMDSDELPKTNDTNIFEFNVANTQVSIDFNTREVIIKQI